MSIAKQKLCAHNIIIINDSITYLFFKRLIDIIFSIIGMLIGVLIIVPLACAIKIEDPRGPIFFSQDRVGKNNKIFKMYKLRSMYVDAEERFESLLHLNEMTGPVFKIKDDPRITKVGRFLRKTSLDEIPQFFNILKGDMSLVGPRPAILREVEQYSNFEKQRLLVKPGLTCIWQVSGRNNIDFDEWIRMDIEYIKTRNLWLDIKLIFKTIPVFLGDENAS